jgi:PAN domain
MHIREYTRKALCLRRPHFIVLALLTSAAALAGPAVFEVNLAQGNPTRLILKIDTTSWAVGATAPTATLTVTFLTPDRHRINKSYDFLENTQSLTHLEYGHVYQRTLPTGVAAGSSIQSAQLEFPNLDGKTDSGSSRNGPTGSATVIVGGSPVLSFEPRVNRNLHDYSSSAAKSAQECSNLCLQARQCAAYTLVKDAGAQYGTCWLKNAVPPPEPCDNCVSGVKTTP